MMDRTNVTLGGQDYVILPRQEYDRLAAISKSAELPPMPLPGKHGAYPAVEYARASLARKLIRDRAMAGLSQRELARLARVREETICRLETGKHTASIPTVDKIAKALARAAKGKAKK